MMKKKKGNTSMPDSLAEDTCLLIYSSAQDYGLNIWPWIMDLHPTDEPTATMNLETELWQAKFVNPW